MKFNTSAIAIAVAGSVAVPMAQQASADGIYASARIGIENVDSGGTSDLRTRSFASLFGVRSETDLGNGMAAYGRYEWDVDFSDHNEDTGSDNDDIDLRHRYVGLKGDFGNFYLGQTSHTFYKHVIAPFDIPWWGSGYNMVRYGIRTDGAVTYETSIGAANFGISGFFLREDDEDAPDSIEVGASFGIGDMTLGIAVDSSEDPHGSAATDDDIIGFSLSGIALGDASLAVNYLSQDDDESIGADLVIGNVYIHVEQLSSDASGTDPLLVNLGYTQSLGPKTTAWYEILNNDADTGDSDDDLTVIRAVLKYDII